LQCADDAPDALFLVEEQQVQKVAEDEAVWFVRVEIR